MKEKQNLYLIYNKQCKSWEERLQLLESAAKNLDINSIRVYSDTFDYTTWQEIPGRKEDMFYNVTPFNHEVENLFIHKGLTSFFIEPNKINYVFSTHQFDLSLINAGISTPKTILIGTSNRFLLEKYISYLGGFPIIIKATGGSTGVGVIKVDSREGLFSTCDFFISKGIHFQLKEFIENEGTIRVIVIGDKVVTSIMRKNLENDFRVSGNSLNNYLPIELPIELKKISVNAVKACNYEFAGLDLIVDKKGKAFVLEVNYPNDFVQATKFNAYDIAFDAVSYLKEKSGK